MWFDNRLSPTPAGTTSTSTGSQDVWYVYSEDRGQTFSPSIRITDRSIDRSFGIWSNNVDVHAPSGLVSTNEAVYMTWQDSRNGTNVDGSAEDTYFASVYMNGPPAPDAFTSAASGRDIPSWLLVGAGAAAGMGVAMLVLLALSRRAPTAAPTGTPSRVATR
ncbi:MAG: hypothetical protein AB1673_11810 [Actinomycetota bacterium]